MAVHIAYAIVRADSGLYAWLYNQCFSEYIGEYSLGNGVEFFSKSHVALSRLTQEMENNPSLSKAIIKFELDDSDNITILTGSKLEIQYIKKGSIFDNDTTARLIQKFIDVDATPSSLEYFKQLYKESHVYFQHTQSNVYTPSHSNEMKHATPATSATTPNADMRRSPIRYGLDQ
jgi:hypothetical protein